MLGRRGSRKMSILAKLASDRVPRDPSPHHYVGLVDTHDISNSRDPR